MDFKSQEGVNSGTPGSSSGSLDRGEQVKPPCLQRERRRV